MAMTKVCALSDVPAGTAKRFLVDGVAVAVVVKKDDTVHAVGDVCTHAEVSLAEGEIDGNEIECWLHGACFDLTSGKPTSLPAIKPVSVFPVSVEGGAIHVDIANPTNGVPATKES